MFVKVCGVAGPADVDAAAAAGVDAVGLVLSRASVRRLEPEAARRIAAHVRPPMVSVVVLDDMDAAEAARVTTEIGADALQLHGAYTAADFAAAARAGVRLWRATSVAPGVDLRVGAFGEELLLLDSPRAGSGRTWDLSALTEEHRPSGRWLLAGGLAPHNVAEAVDRARPWGVDVSSGVESAPGVKDHARIAAFVDAARGVTSA